MLLVVKRSLIDRLPAMAAHAIRNALRIAWALMLFA